MNTFLIMGFGGSMLAVSFVIKTLEMNNKPELAKQLEVLTLLIGSATIVGALATLIGQVKTVFGM